MRTSLLIVTAAALIAVPPAFGSTASVEDGLLEYVAAPGEVNAVEVSEDGGTVTIVDTGAVITAGAGCSEVSDHEVTCSGVADAGIFLSDLGDVASLLETDSVFFAFQGQDGNDDLSLCSQCRSELNGGSGDDILQSGDVRAILIGREGADTLFGGGGNDDFYGGRGADTIDAAGGSDFIFPGGGADVVDGGPGLRDELWFGFTRVGVVVDLNLGTATGQGTKMLVGIEDVLGTDGPDKLYGDGGDNHLSGLGGGDVLVGRRGGDSMHGGCCRGRDRLFGGGGSDRLLDGRGRDLLVGGAGDDRLAGGPDEDRMFGYAGDDTFRAREGFRDVVRGNAGSDSARVDVGLDVLRSIETLF